MTSGLKKSLLVFLLFFSCFSLAYGQQDPDKVKVIAAYDSVYKATPRERIAVHLDKTNYAPLDTVWFKAYLFDGTLKSAAKYSGLIYFEMIDAKGHIVKSICLPTGAGLTWGGFVLDNVNYSAGTYTFRAYTNWMRNFGDRYFFKKEIKIVDLATTTPEKTATVAQKNTNTPSTKTAVAQSNKSAAIDLQFLPEGGTWIADQTQVMGFKAINTNGMGFSIAGDIVDSKQQKVASFSAGEKGMGYFTMVPKAGETYTAIVKNPIGLKNIILPKVLTTGTSLQLINTFAADSITIKVQSNLVGQELLILGQSRDLLCFVVKMKANSSSKTLVLPKNIFPTGISQIIVTDIKHRPLNERSFFINHGDQLNIDANFSKKNYTRRDSVPMALKVTDVAGNPIVGSFSMAITDDSQVSKDSINNANILSYLLLNAELKGEIENPGSYFHQFNEQKHKELEALLLTQAWVSYSLAPQQKPQFNAEIDFSIRGSVKNLTNKPINMAQVSIVGRNRGKMLMLQTVANQKGEFVFDKFPALDSATLVVQALNAKGKSGTLGVTVNELANAPVSAPLKDAVVLNTVKPDTIIQNFIATKQQVYKREGISLKEVTVIGKKTVKGSKTLNKAGEADQVISEEELEQMGKKTLYDILFERVAGFNYKIPRRSESNEFFIKNNRVKFIIDGLDVDYFYEAMPVRDDHYKFIKDYLTRYNAEDVTGIEIMTSLYNTANYDAVFGSVTSSSSGDFLSYLEITTKSGSGPFLKKRANVYMYKPPTYGDLKVFYSPKYNSVTKTDQKPDLRSTIYWVPNLVTNEKGEAKTSFFTADRKGTYTVWIEGTDMQGNIGMKVTTLKIN
ncbi:Plug and carboxypeptidase regulatory-like domain-containing protein [Pedobacter sp. Hv1]|uniref:Plug and carboxypeptidase regulatory-like domain-containing protein n=1 Tax=Pedobacter sp. Hv1 TaxID=1740090 RepID=UPI0006D8A6DC|nr:Plug and carboxypeptidase regulatory-like domain-containing protein [Pedobacter sp. Hv1]KQC00126.1 hypothetical protein AQF98_13870 [Pedobacter sp. Hv1]